MLKTLDQTLAGAIDVIADDVAATVKSVREQGVMRTLGDAVEDAAGMVKTGAGSVLSNVVGGKKGPQQISNHAGVSSSYADLCAGPGQRSFGPMGGGQPIFPYTPNPSAGKPGAKGPMPKASAGGFAPGIGIQRASAAPQFQNPGGVQVFAKAPAAAAPPAYLGPGAAQMRSYPAPNMPPPAYSAPAPSASSAPSGAKEPPLPAEVLAARLEVIRRRHPANDRCFDCNAANPEWASVSFGIFLCIECGGHHRQMGTHISRIRSCKMDSWTERQLQIFDHSGNKQCADFFAANGVGNSVRYQRYHTPAAEWYREAWIKNRIFDRPVPPPPQGVVVGPCVDKAAAKAAAAKAAPPADLLDFGGDQPAPAKKAAAQADLLGFGDAPAAPQAAPQARSVDADLLGVAAAAPSAPAPAGGDLLNLGGGAAGQAGSVDIFGLAATAQSARPPAAQLASLDFTSQAPLSAAAPAAPLAQAFAAPAPAPAAGLAQPAWEAPAAAAGASPASAANTLGGGAKLVDPPKEEKASDPFAMALEKWGM